MCGLTVFHTDFLRIWYNRFYQLLSEAFKMKIEKEKMLAGELYNPADSELVQDRLNARKQTRIYNQTIETDEETRTTLLKELFGSTGENIYIEPAIRCDYGYNLHVGENFYANFDCVFLDVCEISYWR